MATNGSTTEDEPHHHVDHQTLFSEQQPSNRLGRTLSGGNEQSHCDKSRNGLARTSDKSSTNGCVVSYRSYSLDDEDDEDDGHHPHHRHHHHHHHHLPSSDNQSQESSDGQTSQVLNGNNRSVIKSETMTKSKSPMASWILTQTNKPSNKTRDYGRRRRNQVDIIWILSVVLKNNHSQLVTINIFPCIRTIVPTEHFCFVLDSTFTFLPSLSFPILSILFSCWYLCIVNFLHHHIFLLLIWNAWANAILC